MKILCYTIAIAVALAIGSMLLTLVSGIVKIEQGRANQAYSN